MKGRRAEKDGKERENDKLVTAPASTPFSVSARKALCLASSRTKLSLELRPHKLASSKSDDSPVSGKEREDSIKMFVRKGNRVSGKKIYHTS